MYQYKLMVMHHGINRTNLHTVFDFLNTGYILSSSSSLIRGSIFVLLYFDEVNVDENAQRSVNDFQKTVYTKGG